jgi:cytochrome c
MMSPRANMAFAALLSAGLIAMLSGFFAGKIVRPEPLEKDAVTIEAAESGAGGGAAKVSMPEPILAMIATADIERGKAVAKACAACHQFDKGGANGVGPGLWGVVGNAKDSHPGYAYSGALKASGDPTWTYESLNKFLWKPKAYAKDTKMNFIGVKKPEDRAALIAYLRTMDDAPAALPSQGEIDAEIAELAPPAAETPAADDGEEKDETKAEDADEKLPATATAPTAAASPIAPATAPATTAPAAAATKP